MRLRKVPPQLPNDEFQKSGRVWLRGMVTENDLSLLDEAVSDGSKVGQRLELSSGLMAALSDDSSLLKAVRRVAPNAMPVRIVTFNKSQSVNWGVPWHQDRVISVTNKADVAGFKNWSNKTGIWHCEPPQSVLEEMLFVRVHLDDTDGDNGAMEIAVGSFEAGLVHSEKAESTASAYPIEVCDAKRGDVLVLKMLTLHASKPAKVPSARRVLRIDFASHALPPPLSWHGQVRDT